MFAMHIRIVALLVALSFVGGVVIAQSPKVPAPKVPQKQGPRPNPGPPQVSPSLPKTGDKLPSPPKVNFPMPKPDPKIPVKAPVKEGQKQPANTPPTGGFGGGFFSLSLPDPYSYLYGLTPHYGQSGYSPMSPYGYSRGSPYGGGSGSSSYMPQSNGNYGMSQDGNVYQPRKKAEYDSMDPGSILDAYGIPNDGGQIRWPLAFRLMPPDKDHARKQIEAILQMAGRQMTSGNGNLRYGQMASQALESLRHWLACKEYGLAEASVHEARSFLRKLENAVYAMSY